MRNEKLVTARNYDLANLAPVVGVLQYRRDLVVLRRDIRKCLGVAQAGGEGGARGRITQLSYRSRKRLAFVASNAECDWQMMGTLTYPEFFPVDGRIVKRHLNCFLNYWRRSVGGEYLWFLEFQRREAPHFHFLSSAIVNDSVGIRRKRLKNGDLRKYPKSLQREASERWASIVNSGDPAHLRAGTSIEWVNSVDGAARYVAKYAYKMEQKEVPELYQNVGRFWGNSKGAKPVCGPVIRCNNAEVVAKFPKAAVGGESLSIVFGGGRETYAFHPTDRQKESRQASASGREDFEQGDFGAGFEAEPACPPTDLDGELA